MFGFVVLIAIGALGSGTRHAPVAPHPDSLSRSRLEVEGAAARLTVRFQSLSALEVLPHIDTGGDGALSEGELAAAAGELGNYLLAHWRLFAPEPDRSVDPARHTEGVARSDRAGLAPVPARLEGIVLLDEPLDGALSFQWLEACVVFEADASLGQFTIESRLFLERDPFHRDFVSIFWNDEPEVRVLFAGDKQLFEFEPASVRRPGVLAFFLELGIAHILGGYDHLAFLLVLLVAAPRLKSLVGVVTAFTLAHSITLAAAALDPGGWLGSIPGRFVELAIALSIAYVACENLMLKEARTAWIEAFAFGLLHGLGFAGFLGDALAGENLVVTALFGFNLGVEVGQLAAVVAAALVFAVLNRRRPAAHDAAPGIVPRWFRVLASSVVAVLALYWFAQRAGWVA